MAEPAHGSSVTAETLATLPQAVDPLALSLNESPFPPLPAVRSALIDCLDSANRYPEFLPEQLRRLVADHVGVARRAGHPWGGRIGRRDAGAACGHPARRPDRLQCADFRRLPDLRADGPADSGHRSARSVRLSRPRGNGRGGGGRECGGVVSTAQSDRDSGGAPVCRMVPQADPQRRGRAARRGLHRVRRVPVPDRRAGTGPALPECRCAADLLQGLWAGRSADRLRVRCRRIGAAAVDHAVAIRHGQHSLPSRLPRPTTPKTSLRNAFAGSPPSATTCGCA